MCILRSRHTLLLLLGFILILPTDVSAVIIETGDTSSIVVNGGVTYTAYLDLGTNVSFRELQYDVTGEAIEGKVNVWSDSGYTKLVGTTDSFPMGTAMTTRDISALPIGRYVNITIGSGTQWAIDYLDIITTTDPRVKEIKFYDSTGTEKTILKRGAMKIKATVVSPLGSSAISSAKISINDSKSVLVHQDSVILRTDTDAGVIFEYNFNTSSVGTVGLWSVNVTGQDDSGKKHTLQASFNLIAVPKAAVELLPDVAFDSTNLVCGVTPTSGNTNGNIVTHITWLKDGANQTSLAKTVSIANGTRSEFTVANGNTSPSQKWVCSVLVDDGTEKSASINSPEKVILEDDFFGCMDTDDGEVKETRGHGIGYLEGGSVLVDKEDSCSGKSLTEYYCKDVSGEERVASKIFTCDYYCVEGECRDDYDSDNDGYTIKQGDCNDENRDINPGATEICDDNIDNDCDGQKDESNCGCKNADIRPCGPSQGSCVTGLRVCVDGVWGECVGGIGPATEVCGDGLDNDCDGETDEAECSCQNGMTKPCGSSIGECRPGTQICTNGKWNDCTGNVAPKGEICNGLDDDCDGTEDNDCITEEEARSICSNGVKDPQELGVDCGGVCVKACDYGNIPDIGLTDDAGGVAMWLAVAAIGLLIMGATGVYIMFAGKEKGL